MLGLFGVVVFLEVLFSHFSLDDHQTGVDEGLLEKLTLEHSNQVFDANIFSRWTLNNATVSLNLLLLGQCLLRIGLTLFSESCLMLLKQFGGLLESILGILAVDALIVELSRRGLDLRQHLQHVLGREFAVADQREKETTVRRQGLVQSELDHQRLRVRQLLLF